MYQNQTAAFRFLSVSTMPWLLYMTVKSNMWTEAFKRCCHFAMGYLYERVNAQDNQGWCWWSRCIRFTRLEYRTDLLLKLCAPCRSAVVCKCVLHHSSDEQTRQLSISLYKLFLPYSLLCFLQTFLFSQIVKKNKIMSEADLFSTLFCWVKAACRTPRCHVSLSFKTVIFTMFFTRGYSCHSCWLANMPPNDTFIQRNTMKIQNSLIFMFYYIDNTIKVVIYCIFNLYSIHKNVPNEITSVGFRYCCVYWPFCSQI